MDTLFGSAPKANFSTQPTILPSQDQLLNDLVSMLESGSRPAGVQSYDGTFAAPLNNIQNTSIAALEQLAMNGAAPPGEVKTGTSGALNTLSSALNPSTPRIDATKAFQQGVVQPVTDDFITRVLPALSGQYGGTAGGAYGSERGVAEGQKTTDLARTLAQAGSQYSLGAEQANQTAALTTNAQRNQALSLAPGVLGIPGSQTQSTIADLLSTLQAGSVPYNAAQTQVAGQYQDFLNTQSATEARLKDFLQSFSPQTVNTLGVGTGGSTGLVQGLLGNQGLGQAAGLGLYNWLSDRRAKDNIERVGDVDGFPLYRFKYKGDTTPRLGMMAQDVEKRLPEAVGRAGPFKTVNYGRVIEHLLEAA